MEAYDDDLISKEDGEVQIQDHNTDDEQGVTDDDDENLQNPVSNQEWQARFA